MQLHQRFHAFIAEQFPHLLSQVEVLWDEYSGLDSVTHVVTHTHETTPFITIRERLTHDTRRLQIAASGFFIRESIRTTFSPSDQRWMLRGMITTRAVDLTLKRLFLSGEMQYEDRGFQGKGFRSLGQEAIYAAALRLERGENKDVVAPLIRDLGVVLAFTNDDIELALNAQIGKTGKPLNGKDLHVGDLQRGIVPAAAPLTIATCTLTGMALAAQLKNEKRVFVSFIGEGGSSLGEWHEAINLASVQQLPMIFCIENNQTALSTRVAHQSMARNFGEKALGYGLPHVTIDGTDPEAIASAFAWAAQHARSGNGPVVIEVVSMRMCGHAHHDDMLYLGVDPELSFDYPKLKKGGYVNAELYERWAERDPIATYAKRLIALGVCSFEDVKKWQSDALVACDEVVKSLKKRPWPQAATADIRIYSDDSINWAGEGRVRAIEPVPEFSAKGSTYLEAISGSLEAILRRNPQAYVLGEDVAPPYGNAFMAFRGFKEDLHQRFINTPIAEGAIIGACVGMSLMGLRPIGEMQFNDFVASGFNQLVNNAAKLFYRTGYCVPMVLRMPWGGLRRAGPYHSQDTIPWFYRTAGLKIVAPSTPWDAFLLLRSAVEDNDPVLFYEHIALYRDPSIKQKLPSLADKLSLGKAAFRALGSELTIISYGAFVHRAMKCAQALQEKDGISCDVLDLRSLAPLDFEAIAASVRHTGKVLLVGEDSKTGSVLQSIASRITEELFTHLDAPPKVLGSLDTPVPYSPGLEDGFLVSVEQLVKAARHLVAW